MARKRRSEWARINRSRELRLWTNTAMTVVGGAFTAAMYLDAHPDVKRNLEDKWESFANRFRKEPRIKVYPPTNQK